ncbi:MAG: hypothetical protein ACRDO9_12255 [Gaiellales bacterium]
MIRIVLVLAAVVAAAIAANVALLSVAAGSHDRVGQLSPVLAVSPANSGLAATPSASRPPRPQISRPATAIPARGDEDDIDADD